MNITDTLLNFRSGLVALVPCAERAGIPWKRPDAYDEWDSIAAALFDNLVVQVLQWSLPCAREAKLQLPEYDFLLESYRGLNTIQVMHPALKHGRWVFHAFGTMVDPFDIVELRHLSESDEPLTKDIEICSVGGAQFVLSHKLRENSTE